MIFFRNAAKDYLKALEEDPAATVTLGDSAYARSKIKKELGLQTSVQLRSDGVQLVVRVFELRTFLFDVFVSRAMTLRRVTRCNQSGLLWRTPSAM